MRVQVGCKRADETSCSKGRGGTGKSDGKGMEKNCGGGTANGGGKRMEGQRNETTPAGSTHMALPSPTGLPDPLSPLLLRTLPLQRQTHYGVRGREDRPDCADCTCVLGNFQLRTRVSLSMDLIGVGLACVFVSFQISKESRLIWEGLKPFGS